jgi:hypothetical protein
MSAKQSSCDSTGACKPGTIDGITIKSHLSTAGFVAGGVLLAAGIVLVLLSPGPAREAGASVHVAPAVGANGGGAVLSGAW